jgi:2-methylisocitrate lyase-like PEP mutase family enzyme
MTTTRFQHFLQIHHAAKPLLMPNAWDAASALLFQTDGAPAIATSSATLAWSLGYADGSALPRHELINAVARMQRVLTVPLTIDIEDGYSDSPEKVADLICELARMGVVGANLEDGTGAPEMLAAKISASRKALAGQDFFINARTDVYLRKLAEGIEGTSALQMSLNRLAQYQAAGASGAFVPGLGDVGDVARMAAEISMPLNLMTYPGMPAVAALFAAGAKRFTVGPGLFQAGYAHAREHARSWIGEQQCQAMYAKVVPYAELNTALKAIPV